MSTPQMGQMPGTRAPAAPQPGMGAGNVPFAPGIFGQSRTLNAPLARQMGPGPGPIGGPPQGPPAGPGALPQGGAAPLGGPPPGGPQPMPMMDPQFYMAMVEGYLQALMQAANTPGGGQYPYGSF